MRECVRETAGREAPSGTRPVDPERGLAWWQTSLPREGMSACNLAATGARYRSEAIRKCTPSLALQSRQPAAPKTTDASRLLLPHLPVHRAHHHQNQRNGLASRVHQQGAAPKGAAPPCASKHVSPSKAHTRSRGARLFRCAGSSQPLVSRAPSQLSGNISFPVSKL